MQPEGKLKLWYEEHRGTEESFETVQTWLAPRFEKKKGQIPEYTVCCLGASGRELMKGEGAGVWDADCKSRAPLKKTDFNANKELG